MLRSVCFYALCIAGAKYASDLAFCSWKVPLWWMRNPLLPLFSLYSPFSAHDPTCLICTRLKMHQGIMRSLKSVSHRFQINIYKHRRGMRFWVIWAPCIHKSLQFVSLCEYVLFRNCFGVYANQLWSFQLKVKYVFGNSDHGVNDYRVSRSSRLTLTLPHLFLHTITPHNCSCWDRFCLFVCVYSRGKAW